MSSDFNFKKFQWKKLAAWVLCAILAIPSSSVFAAVTDRGESEESGTIVVMAGANGDVSGSASIQLTKTGDRRYPYTGKAVKPKITVKGSTTGKTIASKNYTVTYGKFVNGKFKKATPKAVGRYSVQITFKGAYKNFPICWTSFTIVPPAVTVKSFTAKPSELKISWKKASQLDGYEIGISSDKDFKALKMSTYYVYLYPSYSLDNYYSITAKKSATSAKIKTLFYGYGSKESVSVKKLPKGTYYVRIRGYKDVKTTYTERHYGNWSTVKSFTVK